MHWREDILGIIGSEQYCKLHVLTHPIWYGEFEDDIRVRVEQFIRNANKERYYHMRDNIKDIEEIIKEGEIL